MDCEKVSSLYTLFKDEILDEPLRDEVLQHIQGCAECKRLYASLDRITTVAGTFKEEMPKADVIENIIEQFDRIPAQRWFLSPRWVLGYTVVILFIAGFSFGLIRRINTNKQMIAKQQEQEIKRQGKYIMDYGQFEKGQVIYSVPGVGNTIQVVETSY